MKNLSAFLLSTLLLASSAQALTTPSPTPKPSLGPAIDKDVYDEALTILEGSGGTLTTGTRTGTTSSTSGTGLTLSATVTPSPKASPQKAPTPSKTSTTTVVSTPSSSPSKSATPSPSPSPSPCCFNNTDGTALGVNTLDDCVIKDKGNVCRKDEETDPKSGKKKTVEYCCDWTEKRKNADGSNNEKAKCECNTKVEGPCDDDKVCSCCMALAEASTENGDDCTKAVLCVLKWRKDKMGDSSQCKTNTRKGGTGGNGAWFTPDKCTCDRVDQSDDSKSSYSQTYCDCREKKCKGEDMDPAFEKKYDAICDQYDSLDCSDADANFYNNGSGLPCAGAEVTGPTSCKHTFYKCPWP